MKLITFHIHKVLIKIVLSLDFLFCIHTKKYHLANSSTSLRCLILLAKNAYWLASAFYHYMQQIKMTEDEPK